MNKKLTEQMTLKRKKKVFNIFFLYKSLFYIEEEDFLI